VNRVQRLLREPPKAFRMAVDALHQDSHYDLETGMTLAEIVAEGTYGVDHRALYDYVDALLTEPTIDDADLRALFNRNCSSWAIQTSDARVTFEEVRAVLKNELKIR
jgi:hypothetical protein